MRGTVVGMETPHPIGAMLPAILQEDELAMQLTAGFDDVMAPIIATLDCLYAYVDPRLAPPDFLDWLADWVGVALDENWPMERRRVTVLLAISLYQSRGTVAGLREHLEVVTGGEVDINDSGGVVWSTAPDGEFPETPQPRLAVRVTAPDSTAVRQSVVDAIVCAAKPAHVVHRVELLD
jgi:phage tail-like protein